jgi:large subunit ribosomal protein L30
MPDEDTTTDAAEAAEASTEVAAEAPAAADAPKKPAARTRKKAEPKAKPVTLKVTQVRSSIGTKPKHRGTLRALGLRGIGKTNELPDRPEIRGMIARVPHLISVEEVSQ